MSKTTLFIALFLLLAQPIYAICGFGEGTFGAETFGGDMCPSSSATPPSGGSGGSSTPSCSEIGEFCVDSDDCCNSAICIDHKCLELDLEQDYSFFQRIIDLINKQLNYTNSNITISNLGEGLTESDIGQQLGMTTAKITTLVIVMAGGILVGLVLLSIYVIRRLKK